MKQIIIALLILVSATKAQSQDTITSAQVATYLGKEVVLVGEFTEKNPLSKSGKLMYFINMDGYYPNHKVALVLFQVTIEACGLDRLEALSSNKQLYVPGIISSYPYNHEGINYPGYQIVIKDCKQLGL